MLAITYLLGRGNSQLPTLPICVLPFVSKLPNGMDRALNIRPGRDPQLEGRRAQSLATCLAKSTLPGQSRRHLANGDIQWPAKHITVWGHRMDSKLPTTKDLGRNGQIRHFIKHGQHLTSLIWRSLSRSQEQSLSIIPTSFLELPVFSRYVPSSMRAIGPFPLARTTKFIPFQKSAFISLCGSPILFLLEVKFYASLKCISHPWECVFLFRLWTGVRFGFFTPAGAISVLPGVDAIRRQGLA